MLKPAGGGYASQHVKCWILDEKVVLSGSVNLTHNGLERNKEHLYEIREVNAVKAVQADFEADWNSAEEITPELFELLKAEKEKRAKAWNEQRTKGVIRSLCDELETVAGGAANSSQA